MTAREVTLTRGESMKEAVAALRAVVKTQKVSIDQAGKSVTVEGTAREAGLGEWLLGELDSASPSPQGHGYMMPNDNDDVTMVICGLPAGDAPAGAPRAMNLADLQEIATAIRLLSELPKAEVYAPTNALVWRGKAWQNDFALWLLRDLASPPVANSTVPLSYHLEKTSPSARIFYFPSDTTPQKLRQIVSALRSKSPTERVVAINATRSIALRGTDVEAAAAAQIIEANRH
jgi:hypothetical protein